ncbi:Cytochrome-c peroxidase [Isosphaera pallida ATCC 43644]|uniref:Methylamine utilization protein MauG n=1 Tax=Isosphaera pallida (strain ATCC 43644 / DSM 9630 / IS1B) TaxID=575540 RepID=E8R2Y5_ISOPI|nr:cytochrome c peroxidase [Isosphaera pallida]ADV61489.1 Cytochrome-c peroxidase [Isosphaera pallida ATCC 43644]
MTRPLKAWLVLTVPVLAGGMVAVKTMYAPCSSCHMVPVDSSGGSDSPTANLTLVSVAKPTLPPVQEKQPGDKLAAQLVKSLVDPLGNFGDDKDYLYQKPDPSLIQDEPLEMEPPRGLPALFEGVNIPVSNPLTKGRVELGRQLYFDPRLSKNGTVSCATCHNPETGWTDNQTLSIGIDGQVGNRNAPTVLNTVYGTTQFWDGRVATLEAQCQGPPQNPIEMGDQSYREIVERLRGIPGYVEQFKKVFGTNVTLDGIAKAIASFERVTALSGDSRYDRYQDGDLDALTESEKRGMVLFGLSLRPDDETEFSRPVERQKAKCTLCHVGANFTDNAFHNLGVGYDTESGTFSDLGRWLALPIGEKNEDAIGAFKTPTLRDITRTAPYMHDGSEPTLEAVMDLYNKGGIPNPYLDRDMKPLNLTKEEIADVIAFMKALDGAIIKVEVPQLPPGPDGKAPDARRALMTPTKGQEAAE